MAVFVHRRGSWVWGGRLHRGVRGGFDGVAGALSIGRVLGLCGAGRGGFEIGGYPRSRILFAHDCAYDLSHHAGTVPW